MTDRDLSDLLGNVHHTQPLDNTEYHAHPAISKSHLDQINRSPLHYWSRYIDPNRVPVQPTVAMELGTAVHMAVLEPELFLETYTTAPGISKTTKAGKEAWAEAEAGGKKLLKPEELDQIDRMHQSLLTHPGARKALKSTGKAEQSIFAVDPATGLEMKCRPDYLTDSGWVIDLKTTTDASVDSFSKSTANFRYHVQAAWYLHVVQAATGERPKGFVFLVVEKTAPFAVQVFKAGPELLEIGHAQALADLQRIAECKQTYTEDQPWPGYPETATVLSLPPWVKPATPQLPQLTNY